MEGRKRTKKRMTAQEREVESADKHRGSYKQKILMTPKGREICWKLRREPWYQLMSAASDKVFRRLAASILMASALDEVRPKRFNRG